MSTKKLQILGSLGSDVELDTTLEQEGKAADAKAVGDTFAALVGDTPVAEQISSAVGELTAKVDYQDITETYSDAAEELGYEPVEHFLTITAEGKYYINTGVSKYYCEIHKNPELRNIYHTITDYTDDGLKSIWEFIDGEQASYVEYGPGQEFHTILHVSDPTEDYHAANKKYVDDNITQITPVRGTDYWTDEDKAEIKSYVDEAILGGAW